MAVTLKGVGSIDAPRAVVPGSTIAIAGIVLYVTLLLFTNKALHRTVTTELFLIVGWCVLEAVVLNVLYGAGIFSAAKAVAYLALAMIAFLIGMVCYLLYYRLPDMTAFRVAAVPLITDGVCMAILVGMMAGCR